MVRNKSGQRGARLLQWVPVWEGGGIFRGGQGKGFRHQGGSGRLVRVDGFVVAG